MAVVRSEKGKSPALENVLELLLTMKSLSPEIVESYGDDPAIAELVAHLDEAFVQLSELVFSDPPNQFSKLFIYLFRWFPEETIRWVASWFEIDID